MIEPPVQNISRALWRAALEAAAGFSPVTAALARIYQVTFPPKFEQDLATWRAEVSATLNNQAARLATLDSIPQPPMKLSADAQALAAWIAKDSANGLAEPIGFDDIGEAFPEAPKRNLEDAANELAMYGLAEVSKALGHPVRLVRPDYDLFALFDPVVLGSSPQSDAVEIAKVALEFDEGHAPALEGHLGWPRRRFNPAFALLLTLVGPGSVRTVIQPDYPSLGFAMGSEERVRFRRLIAESCRGDAV